MSVAPEPAPFRILQLFFQKPDSKPKSIVLNVAESGGQKEMFQCRAYCAQISWFRHRSKLNIKLGFSLMMQG